MRCGGGGVGGDGGVGVGGNPRACGVGRVSRFVGSSQRKTGGLKSRVEHTFLMCVHPGMHHAARWLATGGRTSRHTGGAGGPTWVTKMPRIPALAKASGSLRFTA